MRRNNKKLMIPLLSFVLIAAMAGTALAYIDTHFMWKNWLYTVYDGYNVSQYNHVRSVQHITSLYPACEGICIDGDYGPATTENVEDFQDARGLTVDGRTGPNTWGSLQYRINYEYTTSGDDFYSIDCAWSDYGEEVTDTEYFRHYDDANGTWKYYVGASYWGTIR